MEYAILGAYGLIIILYYLHYLAGQERKREKETAGKEREAERIRAAQDVVAWVDTLPEHMRKQAF